MTQITTNDDVLATLVAQSELHGSDRAQLVALVEAASEAGAQRALAGLGLADAAAHDDVRELRQLLSAWRDAKSSAWKAVIGWVVRGVLALLLLGIAYRLGLTGLLR